MQVLIGERPRLAHRASGEGKPVIKRTCRDIEELAEKILAQKDRRNRVAPDRILQTAVKRDRVRAQVQHGSDAAIEITIVGVAILDDVYAGKKKPARGKALTHKSRDHRQAINMYSVVRIGKTLKRTPGWRQQRRIRDVQYPRIQRVNIDIFKRWREGSLRQKTYILVDRAPFLNRKFVLRSLSSGLVILSGDRIRLRERRQCMHRVLSLPVQIRGRYQVIVIVGEVACRTQAGQRFRRLVSFPFGNV